MNSSLKSNYITYNTMQSSNKFCLVMIVRDEAHIVEKGLSNIARCLTSVNNIFDNYVICDTGSIDNTKEIITDFMKKHDKEGFLIEKEWKNFGFNKSYLLDVAFTKNLSKGAKYLMWLDADEVYLNKKGKYPTIEDKDRLFKFLESNSESGIFMMQTHYGNLKYMRWQFVRNNQLYIWKSPAHEYLVASNPTNTTNILFLTLLARNEGNSSRDPERTKKYIKMFKEFLLENPKSPRETFYLASSLSENGQYEEAIKYFKMRTRLGGYYQEKYISMLRVGNLYFRQLENYNEAELWLSSASTEFIDRLEAPLELLYLYYRVKKYEEGMKIVRKFDEVSRFPSNDKLFIETDVYDWKYDLQASLISYHVGEYTLALKYGRNIISRGKYPQNMESVLNKNLEFFSEKATTVIKNNISFPVLFIPKTVIVDNFFPNPNEIRDFALSQDFSVKGNYPGKRTKSFASNEHKEIFEKMLGRTITYWPKEYNGSFQITNSTQKSWIHRDLTDYSALIYLTPNAPLDGGTTIYSHKSTGLTYAFNKEDEDRLSIDSSNKDAWDIIDSIGNVYNRLVIFNGKRSHKSTSYFGTDNISGRLFMVFFFNV